MTMAPTSYPPTGHDATMGSLSFVTAPGRPALPREGGTGRAAAVVPDRDPHEGGALDADAGAGAYIARPYRIPAWLVGTAAEASLVNAYTLTDDLGDTLRGVSLAAKRLRDDTRRVTARVLAARFAPLDSLPVGVVCITEARIVMANTTFASLVGRNQGALEYAPWWDLVAPEDAEALAAAAFGAEVARVLAAAYLPDRAGPRSHPHTAGNLPAVATDVAPLDTPGRNTARVAVRVLIPSATGGASPDRRALVWEVGPVHRGVVYCVVRPAASRLTPVPPAQGDHVQPPETPREPG